jgi:hypothetical protein
MDPSIFPLVLCNAHLFVVGGVVMFKVAMSPNYVGKVFYKFEIHYFGRVAP